MKTTQLDIEDCAYIEKLFFEYNSALRIFRYLVENKVQEDDLIYYRTDCDKKFAILEIAKSEMVFKYLHKIPTQYNFNFVTEQLEYEEH